MDLAVLFKVINPPAPPDVIAALIVGCGGTLPASYSGFLSRSNGAEWCINDQEGDCLSLWGAGEIVELNAAYAIPRFLPEFLAIGSDGGGDAVGFDKATSPDAEEWSVVRIGFGNLDRDDFRILAPSFRDWERHGFPLRPGLSCCEGG